MMKDIRFNALLFTGIILLITSCSKENSLLNLNKDLCEAPAKPAITANKTHFIEGDTLILDLKGQHQDGMDYQWSGPAGFSDHYSFTYLNNLKPENSGIYKLVVIDDTCHSPAASVEITVDSLQPACDPEEHTLTINGSEYKFGPAQVSQTFGYKVRVSNSTLRGLDMVFASKPEPGHYDVSNEFYEEGKVRLTFWPGGSLNLDHDPKASQIDPPQVFVRKKHGKLTYTFCNITFWNHQTSLEFVIDGKLVEK